VGTPPGHDLRDLLLAARRGPRRDTELGAGDHVERPQRRPAIAEVEIGGGEGAGGAAGAEVDDQSAAEHLGGVTAVPAGVHAHRAADAPGDAHVELEAAEPGGRAPAG
jgi:hypothetical protein